MERYLLAVLFKISSFFVVVSHFNCDNFFPVCGVNRTDSVLDCCKRLGGEGGREAMVRAEAWLTGTQLPERKKWEGWPVPQAIPRVLLGLLKNT